MSLGARRVELDCAGPPHWRGSPPFSGANAGSAHSARRAVSVSCFCLFSLSLSLLLSSVSFHPYFLTTPIQPHTLSHVTPRLAFIPLFPISLFLVAFLVSLLCLFSLLEIKRNFVPRKRFKRYWRGLKTCFVRRKRFSWNKTVCDVDDLVILSRGARRVELDCAGPPHWRGSPPFSGANAGSAHSTRRACARCCYFTGSKKLKWTRP